MEKKKISRRDWILIWILAFCGQMCWAVENNTFATYALAKTGSPDTVTWMVALSAATTTIARFISGTLGDRLGRRRRIIAIGFILWGIFTIAFGLADFIPQNDLSFIAVYLVAMDAVMSFCGSIGYSGGVNPWTTDISDESNRGSVSAAISSMVIIANIVVLGLQGFIVETFGFLPMFAFMGAFVLLIGVLCFLVLRDSPDLKPSVTHKSFWAQVLAAFNFRETFRNKALLWMLLTLCVYTIGFNIYMSYATSYLWIYFPVYSGIEISKGSASIIQGIGMLLGVVLSVFFIKPINRGQCSRMTLVSVIVSVFSLIMLGFSKNVAMLYVFISLSSFGYVLCLLATTAWFKNLCPEDRRGQLEGIKQIFYNLVPMIIGPVIAATIIKKINFVINVDGVDVTSPTNVIFMVAGIFTVLTLIPLFTAMKYEKQTQA